MSRRLLLLLVVLALAPAAALAQCDTSTWFEEETVDLDCPTGDSGSVALSVPWAADYPNDRRVEALRERRGDISLRVEYLAPDLAPETVDIPASDVVVNRTQVGIAIPFEDLRKRRAIQTLKLVFPPESLFCEDELVDEETTLEIAIADEEGNPQPAVSCLVPGGKEASRPLDWRIDLAPADDDAQDDPGVAVDFTFDKDWGYGFRIDPESRSWSTNLWRLKLDGSGSTNDADFHDSLTADFSWARNIAYVGDGLNGRPFTAWWWGAYVRPETTFDEDVRDYVYGARLEALFNLRKLIGTDVGTGTRPYLALGFEQVDPDEREDGTVPGNYERATADFLWKFSPFERIRIEVDWEAKYLFDEDDLAILGVDNRLQDKLDLGVALDVSGQRQFMPFLKYTRGAEAPRFEVVEEILFGLAWDRLFPGEAPE